MIEKYIAEVVELVDALDSKSSEGNLVTVRVRPSAFYFLKVARVSSLVERLSQSILDTCSYFPISENPPLPLRKQIVRVT